MMYAGSSVMANKPAAGLCVCRRGGATAAFQSLNMPFQMTNMPVVTSQYWNILYGCAEGETALDVEGLQTVRTLANNMSWLIKKIATGEGDAPVLEPRTPMNFIR
jgi:multimeric flavodoxin WrbA